MLSPLKGLRRGFMPLIALAVLAVAATAAKADTFTATCVANTCTVGPTSNSQGQTVNATASFVFGAGTVTITLKNNLTNGQVVAVNQNISGLYFSLASGQTTGTLSSSSSPFTSISGNTATPGGSAATGWIVQNNVAGGLALCVICSGGNAPAGPEQTIIGGNGTGAYGSVNGSINGNGPHNPFLYGSAADGYSTFTLSIAGVTANTILGSVAIQFNTEPSVPTSVPEPA
jgi:hypothetical protein